MEQTHVHCEKCPRLFMTEQAMSDHAEAVHTFEDIRRIVGEAVREEYAKPSSGMAGSTWAWVEDLTNDWVVFSVEEPTECNLYKASYSILDSKVALGEATEVNRRTVYEPTNNGAS